MNALAWVALIVYGAWVLIVATVTFRDGHRWTLPDERSARQAVMLILHAAPGVVLAIAVLTR